MNRIRIIGKDYFDVDVPVEIHSEEAFDVVVQAKDGYGDNRNDINGTVKVSLLINNVEYGSVYEVITNGAATISNFTVTFPEPPAGEQSIEINCTSTEYISAISTREGHDYYATGKDMAYSDDASPLPQEVSVTAVDSDYVTSSWESARTDCDSAGIVNASYRNAGGMHRISFSGSGRVNRGGLKAVGVSEFAAGLSVHLKACGAGSGTDYTFKLVYATSEPANGAAIRALPDFATVTAYSADSGREFSVNASSLLSGDPENLYIYAVATVDLNNTGWPAWSDDFSVIMEVTDLVFT